MNTSRMLLASALKARAAEKRWTNVELGDAVGCNEQTISDRFNGRNGSDRFLDKICEVLEWTPADMFNAAAGTEVSP